MDEENDELKQENKDLDAENEQLKQQQNDSQQEISRLRSEIGDLDDQIADLKRQRDDLESELRSLDVDYLQDQLDDLSREIDDRQNEYDDLVEEKEQQISELNRQINEKQSILSELEEKIRDRESKYEEIVEADSFYWSADNPRINDNNRLNYKWSWNCYHCTTEEDTNWYAIFKENSNMIRIFSDWNSLVWTITWGNINPANNTTFASFSGSDGNHADNIVLFVYPNLGGGNILRVRLKDDFKVNGHRRTTELIEIDLSREANIRMQE